MRCFGCDYVNVDLSSPLELQKVHFLISSSRIPVSASLNATDRKPATLSSHFYDPTAIHPHAFFSSGPFLALRQIRITQKGFPPVATVPTEQMPPSHSFPTSSSRSHDATITTTFLLSTHIRICGSIKVRPLCFPEVFPIAGPNPFPLAPKLHSLLSAPPLHTVEQPSPL